MSVNIAPIPLDELKSIILIDDDGIDLFISSKTLMIAGIQAPIIQFKSAVKAFDYFTEIAQNTLKIHPFSPEVIFLDINMPIMNGFEFLEAFNAIEFFQTRPWKVFFLSSSSSAMDMERIKNYGNRCLFIPKPLTVEKVRMALATPFLRAVG